jgi:hypothetical protein
MLLARRLDRLGSLSYGKMYGRSVRGITMRRMDASLDRRSRRRFFQLSLRTLLVCLATMPPLLAAGWAAGSALVKYYWPAKPDVWEEFEGPSSIRAYEINCTFEDPEEETADETPTSVYDKVEEGITHAD